MPPIRPHAMNLALFFIYVSTNVGYSVVAEFVVQSENKENIEEALKSSKKMEHRLESTILYVRLLRSRALSSRSCFPIH